MEAGKKVYKNTHVHEDKDTGSSKVMVILLQLFLSFLFTVQKCDG